MATKKKSAKPAARKASAKRPAKKPAAKKAVKSVKKAASKSVKKAAKPAAVATVKSSTNPIKKAYTKSQIATELAQVTGIARKDASAVLVELGNLVKRHVKQGGAGFFNLPGLLKINTIRKPATKARKGINPFTKEPCMFKAKPARTVVKVRALKGLKDMV